MNKYKKLSYHDLFLDFYMPKFDSTSDLEPFKGIIGQESAEKFIDLGLKLSKKEYNIFISGHSSTGKTSYIVNKVATYAKTLKTPDDWCYVYNFKDDNKPISLCLPAGYSQTFKDDINELIKFLIKEIPLDLNSENYNKQHSDIISYYEEKIMKLNDSLNAKALEKNLLIQDDPSEGIVFIPTIDGEEINSEEYNRLPEQKKEEINRNASELRLLSMEILKQSKTLEKDMEDKIFELDNCVTENILTPKIDCLLEKYSFSDSIVNYIKDLKEDIIDNVEYFLLDKDSLADKGDKDGVSNKVLEDFVENTLLKRYEVNIIVSREKESGAPVIFEDSSDYYNLFGKIEYENKMGNLTTDFTHIRAGNMHKANGGFLIINANDLMNNADIYENLKRALKSRKITVENIKGGVEITPIISLKAESIPLNIKVILIGSDYVYSVLLNNDPDFQKLFKIKAEFDSDILINNKNIEQLIGYITNYIKNKNFLPMKKNAIAEIIKYGCKLSESKLYFSSSIGTLLDIVDISNYFAENASSNFIDKSHVASALQEQNEMHSLVKYKFLDMYKNKQFLLDIKNSKIGQINGLSVSNFGDIEIGMAHRITVATYAGRKGIVNIERETKMSGNIHNKSVMILSGFIGQLLGQETNLSFNASIVFEQLYSGIEGDSASCAELLALLSSLSDIPIKQNLAITGSINQRGEVQPIGGVNQKIEGFFNICKVLGLKGDEGVIIPKINENDLVLNCEVMNAIKENKFHIYTAESIEDCMSLMYDVEIPKKNTIINYTKEKALTKLTKFNSILKSEI